MSNTSHPDFAAEISFPSESFVDLGLSIAQATVLQLVHVLGDKVTPLGTCFAITNSGLCMTARHVVEQGLVRPAGPGFTQMDAEADGAFAALYISPEPNPDDPTGLLGGLLPVWRTWMIDGIDIALVMLELPIDTRTGEAIRFPAHQLRLSPPGVGEDFFGLGYRAMDWTPGGAPHDYNVDHRFSATKGEVEELHLGGRDTRMLPYPCFRTSARLDAGMSGGPLMDHSGRVFGVICSSYELGDHADGYISYGSAVAPSMLITLDANEPGGVSRKALLWDFVEGGAVAADRRGVRATRTEDHLVLEIGQSLRIDGRLNS